MLSHTRLLELIPIEKITSLLVDRKFIGEQWFQWLNGHGILSRLRIREDLIITGENGWEVKAAWLFRHLKPGQTKTCRNRYTIADVKVYVAASRSSKSGELLITIGTDKPKNRIRDYAIRWSI